MHLIICCLLSEFGALGLTDATALERSGDSWFINYRTALSVAQLVEQYGIRRMDVIGSRNSRINPPHLSFANSYISELLEISETYCRVILPLYNLLQTFFLGKLGELGSNWDPAGPSRNEKIRLIRAIYRYATFHNLYGKRSEWDTIRSTASTRFNQYMSLFQPWEMEEICCISRAVIGFMRSTIGRGNIRSRYPDLTGGCKFPRFIIYVKLELPRDLIFFNQIVSMINVAGPMAIEKILRAVQGLYNPADFSLLMENCTTFSNDFTVNCLNFQNLLLRGDSGVQRVLLNFLSEEYTDAWSADSFPYAWFVMWQPKHRNELCNTYLEPLRTSGIVLWNRKRLDRQGSFSALLCSLYFCRPGSIFT
jgi:hypothetical protein